MLDDNLDTELHGEGRMHLGCLVTSYALVSSYIVLVQHSIEEPVHLLGGLRFAMILCARPPIVSIARGSAMLSRPVLPRITSKSYKSHPLLH